MNQICSKVYYLIATGEILLVTEERQGDVIETTKEQDIQVYSSLNGKSVDDIDFIELEYGTLSSTFTSNVKSYSVDVANKKLNIVKYTQEELNDIQQQDEEDKSLNNRVSDISTYLNNSDETTILNIENSILEIEKNKIINGGM